MRFLIGVLIGAILGGVLAILATGNAGRVIQEQVRQRAEQDRAHPPGRDAEQAST